MRASNQISLTPFITQIGTHSVARDCAASSLAQARRPRNQRPRSVTRFTPNLRRYAEQTELKRAEVESTHLALCILYVALFWVGVVAALSLL
jgi:hypothetical protein